MRPSKNGLRDTRRDSSKGTSTMLCLHCNAYTACVDSQFLYCYSFMCHVLARTHSYLDKLVILERRHGQQFDIFHQYFDVVQSLFAIINILEFIVQLGEFPFCPFFELN